MALLPGDIISVDTGVSVDSKQKQINSARKVVHTGSMLLSTYSGALYYYQTNGTSAASYVIGTDYPIDISYRQDTDSIYLASFADGYQLPPVLLYNNTFNYYFDDFIVDYRFDTLNGMKTLWSGSSVYGESDDGVLKGLITPFSITPTINFSSTSGFKVEAIFTDTEFFEINNPDLSLKFREDTSEVAGIFFKEELVSTTGGRYIATLAPSGGYFTEYNSTPEVIVSGTPKRGFFSFFDPNVSGGFQAITDNTSADFFPGTTVTGYIDISVSGYLVTASSTQTYLRPILSTGTTVTRSGQVLTYDTNVSVYWGINSDSATFTGASDYEIVNPLIVAYENITITVNGSNWDYTLLADPSPYTVSPGDYIVDSLSNPTFTGVIANIIDSNTFSLEDNTGVTSGSRFIIFSVENRTEFPKKTVGGLIPFTPSIGFDDDIIDPRNAGHGTIDYQIYYQTTPTGSLATQALSLEQEVSGGFVTRSSNTGFQISYPDSATMFSGIDSDFSINGLELDEFRFYSAQTSGLDSLFSSDAVLFGVSGIRIDEISKKGAVISGIINHLDYSFDFGQLATSGTSIEEVYNYAIENLNLFLAVGEDGYAYMQIDEDLYKLPLDGSLFASVAPYTETDPNIEKAAGIVPSPLYDFSYNRNSGGFLQYTSYSEPLNEINIKTIAITGTVPTLSTRQLFLDVPEWTSKEFSILKKSEASSYYLHGIDHNSLYVNTISGVYITSTGNLSVSGSNGHLYDTIDDPNNPIALSGSFVQTGTLEYFIADTTESSFIGSYNIDINVPAFAGVNLSDTSLRAGTTDTSTVTTEVINAWGDPLNGVLVQYDVILGDGVVVPQNSTTNPAGESTTTFNVGTTPGQVTIRGTVSD